MIETTEKPEIYVSTDVETDGPIPGPHSLLSIGCAAYLADKTLVSTFSVNLETLPDASGHPKTMAWWETQKLAWEACRKDCQSPEQAMRALLAWIKTLPGIPVFVAYPVTFDFMFVQWYLLRFAGTSPFAHSGIDMRTLAMALTNSTWRRSSKVHLPQRWFDPLPHTHIALDDALEQGAMFCNMLAELRSQRRDVN
jgi:DNA polymerase III alpha subunit (gram-positive type)